MQITKEFTIHEVMVARVLNAPFKIVLESDALRPSEYPSLTFDTDTCARHNIPISLNLVGRTLICSFESRELPLRETGNFVDTGTLKDDDLVIHSLKRSEEMSILLQTAPPMQHNEVSQTLELSTFPRGRGPLPCPFYSITLKLTDEEYKACRALSPASVFRASFHLA